MQHRPPKLMKQMRVRAISSVRHVLSFQRCFNDTCIISKRTQLYSCTFHLNTCLMPRVSLRRRQIAPTLCCFGLGICFHMLTHFRDQLERRSRYVVNISSQNRDNNANTITLVASVSLPQLLPRSLPSAEIRFQLLKCKYYFSSFVHVAN